MMLHLLASIALSCMTLISCSLQCSEDEGKACTRYEHESDEPGEALLQVDRRELNRQKLVVKLSEEPISEDPDGPLAFIAEDEEPLTKEGFDNVNAQCCILAMEQWVRRKIDEMGLEVCFEGGLSGLLPFFSCQPQMTYEKMIVKLDSESKWECPWLRKKNLCPKDMWPASCPSAPLNPNWHRRRTCKKTTKEPPDVETTTPSIEEAPSIEVAVATAPPPPSATKPPDVTTPKPPTEEGQCCKEKTSLLFTAKVSPAASKIKPFDCQKYPGFIQVLKEKKKGGYDVKQLDTSTGVYNELFLLPFIASGASDPFNSMNAASINPIDGIAYGVFTFESKKEGWLARFDDTSVEFVAKVRAFSVAGSFNTKGTYYYLGGGGMCSIKDVATLPGFATRADAADMSNDAAFVTGFNINMQDIVGYVGDLEGSGKDGEYVIGLHDSQFNQLTIIKDSGAASKFWTLATTDTHEVKGFGSAFYFNGNVYFAGNSGTSGVFQIPVTKLNLKETSVMVKKVCDSEKTQQNDGMNCMDLDPPVPLSDGCGAGFEEVSASSDGTCPVGSFRA